MFTRKRDVRERPTEEDKTSCSSAFSRDYIAVSMDAYTSDGVAAGAEESKKSTKNGTNSEAEEFCPGFKDVDAFVKVSRYFSVVIFCFRPR